VKVEDLLRGIVVQSGNDACIVVAENLGVTEAEFAHKMTKRAREIGLTDSTFANATGWPNPDQLMSARDLAYSLTENIESRETRPSFNASSSMNTVISLLIDAGAMGLSPSLSRSTAPVCASIRNACGALVAIAAMAGDPATRIRLRATTPDRSPARIGEIGVIKRIMSTTVFLMMGSAPTAGAGSRYTRPRAAAADFFRRQG